MVEMEKTEVNLFEIDKIQVFIEDPNERLKEIIEIRKKEGSPTKLVKIKFDLSMSLQFADDDGNLTDSQKFYLSNYLKWRENLE